MAELSNEHKRFIIEALACYDPPKMIMKDLKEQFGVDVTLQQISYYNPANAQGKRELAAEWKEHFERTREAVDKQTHAVPIANPVVRLRRLQRIVDGEKADKTPIVVMNALKQAAMDAGGMFTRPTTAQQDDGGETLSAEFDAAIEKIYKPTDSTDDPPESSE